MCLVSVSVKFRNLWQTVLMATLLSACATNSPTDNAQRLVTADQQAQSYYQAGDYANALVAYRYLAKEINSEAIYWYFMGNCYARLNLPNDAIKAYREALVRRPDYAKAWHNLVLVEAKLLALTMAEMSESVSADEPLMKKVGRIHERLNDVVFGEK